MVNPLPKELHYYLRIWTTAKVDRYPSECLHVWHAHIITICTRGGISVVDGHKKCPSRMSNNRCSIGMGVTIICKHCKVTHFARDGKVFGEFF